MSVAEKLGELDADIQQHLGRLVAVLPYVLKVVEASEAAVKIEATSSYKSIYSAPGEMASPLRNALMGLEAALEESDAD